MNLYKKSNSFIKKQKQIFLSLSIFKAEYILYKLTEKIIEGIQTKSIERNDFSSLELELSGIYETVLRKRFALHLQMYKLQNFVLHSSNHATVKIFIKNTNECFLT